MKQISEESHNEVIWKNIVGIDIDFKQVYKNKIINIKDNRFAEANFKIIHRILPCGVNLHKWKKKTDNKCDVCDNKESIEHLFECLSQS